MSSPRILMDASVLIAFLRREEGYGEVLERLSQSPCAVCSVQVVEVMGKLVGAGLFTAGQVETELSKLMHLLEVLPFDPAAQEAAAFYYARRRPYDLSLGDALCLGLAETLKMDILTAERGWAEIPGLPVNVILIR